MACALIVASSTREYVYYIQDMKSGMAGVTHAGPGNMTFIGALGVN